MNTTTAKLFSDHCDQPLMPKPGLDHSLLIIILIIISVAVAIVLITTTTAPGSGGGAGTLAGTVTIGPLCPVRTLHGYAGRLSRCIYRSAQLWF